MDISFHVPEVKSELPFVSVDYDEGDPSSYRGIVVIFGEEEREDRINTGDFTRDLNRISLEYTPFLVSSTVHTYLREIGM